jgi:Ras-related protein Rab-11A
MSDTEDNDAEDPEYKYVPCRKPKGDEVSEYSFIMLAVVGAPGVGKSSILKRFAEREFSDQAIVTIGYDHVPAFIMSNARGGYKRKTSVTLVDTAGQERFMAMTPSKIRQSRGVFLVFDSTSQESYRILERWALIVNEANEFCCRMLVANKMDLYKKLIDEEQWMNKFDWSKEAKRLGCHDGFFCVSAREGDNIDSMVVEMVDAALDLEDELVLEAQAAKIDTSLPTPGGGGRVDLRKGDTSKSKNCKC